MVERIATWVSKAPQPDDLPFLRRAFAIGPTIPTRFHSLEALDRLGERGEVWESVLRELDHAPSLRLRMRASAALARIGDSAGLARLAGWAESATLDFVRAEALGWLVQAGGLRDPARLTGCLAETNTCDCVHAAVEALAAVASPWALTALLRAGRFSAVRAACDGQRNYVGKCSDRIWTTIERVWDPD